jgi:hypothetical protein
MTRIYITTSLVMFTEQVGYRVRALVSCEYTSLITIVRPSRTDNSHWPCTHRMMTRVFRAPFHNTSCGKVLLHADLSLN